MPELNNLTLCPRPLAADSLMHAGRLAVGAAVLAFAGCGGGGNSGGYFPPPTASTPPPVPTTGPAPAPAPVSQSLTGTAATGAAFAGAQLVAIDKTGTTVCDTTVNAQGTYACDLPSTAQAPIVIRAIRDGQALYSVTATGNGKVNVTPLTTIIVSRLAPQGDPSLFADAVKADVGLADAAKIKAQSDAVLALLRPLLDALGDTVDPLTGAFTADGTGHDRVLDSIAVSVRPDGTAANIEITVRTRPVGATEGAPVAISFRSSDAAPTPLPPIAADLLAPAGLSQSVAALMERLTACYALPLTSRVNTANDTTAATGGAADVKASQCRTLFVDDNPATYLNGGSRVGRDSAGNGSFTGLFRPGATGAVWDQGAFQFYRPNGDMVVNYRTLDSVGGIAYDTLVVRDVAGTLKVAGNQYAYSSSVRAAVQERDFINAPAYTYVNVGYDISVANQTDSNGSPIFTMVEVTTPDNSLVTLVPTVGNNGLRIRRPDGTLTGTSIMRLNAAYRNSGTAGSPTTSSENLYYVSPRQTDAQIGATPDQGVWKLEFFHVDATKPNVIQTHRTLTRAYTLAEASQVTFAQLTPTMRTFLQNMTAGVGRIVFTTSPSAGTPNAVAWGTPQVNAWDLPPLAVIPATFSIYGTAPTLNGVPGAAFDDTTSLAASARTAYVTCTRATNADAHCDSTTGITQFATGTSFNYVQLIGRSKLGMEHFSGVSLYTP